MPDNIFSQFDRQYAAPIETNRQVANITARDAINNLVRWIGMMVYVLSEDKTYELRGGIDNSDWQEFTGIDDAPADGNAYARQDNDWVIVASGQPIRYIENNGNFYKTLKGYGNASLGFEVGDEIYYRDAATKKRGVYYILNATLTLPADFSDRAKIDTYNEAFPLL